MASVRINLSLAREFDAAVACGLDPAEIADEIQAVTVFDMRFDGAEARRRYVEVNPYLKGNAVIGDRRILWTLRSDMGTAVTIVRNFLDAAQDKAAVRLTVSPRLEAMLFGDSPALSLTNRP